MSNIQCMLDEILRGRSFVSIIDLQFFEYDEERVIYIRRKIGRKSIVIDISADKDLDAIRNHLESLSAFY